MILATNVEIKSKMLTAFSKEQLTALKKEYGKEAVSFVWKKLSSDEKKQIQNICSQTDDSPEEIIVTMAKEIKRLQRAIVLEMAEQNVKTVKDDEIKVTLRTNSKSESTIAISELN